ncbi:C40 family peptidase [Streptomyces sp. HYC2]|uniref:C40 family peptidase n=1 Tax=Streptomyces sp. HYC2 TaxID=2955207 RepID=UPI002480A6F5|nr:C40 family peptidase [Streptomyces sp. HYC2]
MASHSSTRPAATPGSGTPGPGTHRADGDGPSPEEVERKLDYLYGRAGSSTARNDAQKDTAHKDTAQKKGARQRGLVAALLDDVAKRADMLGKAREMLGSFAAAPYRNGDTAPETAALLLGETPQGYFDQAQLISRLNTRRESLVDGHTARPPAPEATAPDPVPAPAPGLPGPPAEPQHDIAAAKAAVQRKLAHARVLLLSAPQAHEALRATEPAPRTQAAEHVENAGSTVRAANADNAANAVPSPGQNDGAAPGVPSGVFPGRASGPAQATRADQALAFAREQIGKPYVWGAAGPGSYDCSGLTQAAWKAAGVTLPRAARDQAHAGTTVPLSEARPGDLVFFAFVGDPDHVGLYAGDGVMIHAPRPGGRVREESVHHDGESAVHRVVRPD